MITSQEPSPSPPHLQGPLPAMQPRNRNRPSYVQRWKVLRDRNKNLPKLDFAAKATGVTKKIQGMEQLGRSLTYDSMKLPSISTCSVVTGVSGKSVHSDGYRKPSDSWDKKSTFMDLASGSYPDLTSRSELPELTNTSTKEAPTDASVTADEKKADTHAHRYENITYKKQLLMRRRTKFSENDVQKRKEKAILAQAEDHLKQTIEKELSFVKNKQALVKRQLRRKEHKSEFQLLQQSGIYQIDLSNVRNEIPPVTHVPHPPRGQSTSARSYRGKQHELLARESGLRDSASGNIKGRVSRQKWRDNCDCLRCSMIRRQYHEGDLDAYKNWGTYPCMKLGKFRPESDYDSD